MDNLSQTDSSALTPSSSMMMDGIGQQKEMIRTVVNAGAMDDMTELSTDDSEWREESSGAFGSGAFLPIAEVGEGPRMAHIQEAGESKEDIENMINEDDFLDGDDDLFNEDSSGLGNIVKELNGFASTRQVHGRETEKEELLKCWRRCNRYKTQELVVIKGRAGLGKSTLANSLRSVIAEEDTMSFFICAKFAETNHHSKGPFDVFVSAFSDYVYQLFDTEDSNLIENVKQKIKAAVKRDKKHLVQIIPAFEQILVRTARASLNSDASSVVSGGTANTHTTIRRKGNQTQLYGSESAYRLRNTFVKAVGAICSVTPLCICLDDVQSAGAASLDLIRGLMQSSGSMPLLLIGCERDQSLDATSFMSAGVDVPKGLVSEELGFGKALLQNVLAEFENNDSVRLTRIELSNLKRDSVVGLVAEVLHKELSEAAELSNSIYLTTNGNVFHVFQILRYLVDQGIIRYSEGEWTWDDSAVTECLMSPNSVLELVLGTITALPQPAQDVLKVASCLGNEIDAAAVDVVLLTQSGPHLEQAAAGGLLMKTNQYGVYKFSHDWIRHAAFSLIPENERAAFHLKLGQRLWKSSSSMGLDQNVMLIVSLMNLGGHLLREKRERYKLAAMNLKAGKRALDMPSFPDAARFLRKGIEMLDENCWEDNYKLSLDLYSNLAEIETINGNFDFVSTCINKVLKNARNLDDKIQAYAALVMSMEQQDDLEEATSVTVDVVGKLGERLPSKASKLTAAREFLKVRFALRGKSDKDIMMIAPMVDENKRKCMEFLSLGFVAAWRSKSPMSAIFAFRAVLLSLNYGHHTASSLAFAVYGATLCGLHIDVHEGYRMGALAIKMAERSNSLRYLSHSLNFGGGCVAHWTKSVDRTIEYLEHSRGVAMDSGHAGPGCQGWLLGTLYHLVSGKQLSLVKKASKELLQQTKLYRQRGTEISISLVLQLIDCYDGTADDPSRLTGSVIDYEASLLESKNSHDQVAVLQHYYFQMELYYFFGKFEEAGQLADLIYEGNSGSSPTLTAAMLQFDQALVALALWKRGVQRSKNRKRANKFIGNFIAWAKDSPDTFDHIRCLLEAEMRSITAPIDENWIVSCFDLGFSRAEKQGNIMIMALTKELLGCYLGARGKRKEAYAQLGNAAELYSDWGATKKSEILKTKLENDDFERDFTALTGSMTCF